MLDVTLRLSQIYLILLVICCYCRALAKPADHSKPEVSVNDQLAYHLLHPNEDMHFLPRILEEIPHYPVETHLFIHTHTHVKLHLPDHFDSKHITVIRHDIDREVSNQHAVGRDPTFTSLAPQQHRNGGKKKNELRAAMLAITPTLREQIIKIGELFGYSMYSEDDVFVRRETVAMWMDRHARAFDEDTQVGFIRVECTLTVCKSIDLRTPTVPRAMHFSNGQRNHAQVPVTHSGVWIYTKQKLQWLDQHYPPFLRFIGGACSNGLECRESISIGGAGAFNSTLYALNDQGSSGAPSLLPEVMVLHWGIKYWHLGVWWCKIMPNLPKCLDPPEEFFSFVDNNTDMVIPATGALIGVGADTRIGKSVARDIGAHTRTMAENTTRLISMLAPLALSTCRVTDIHFNRTGMHHISTPAMSVPAHPLRVGYAPWLTKAGSSSAIAMLTQITDTLKVPVVEYLTEELLDEYTFISFIRNPVDRALAGYHQLEIFYVMGWLDRTVSMYGVSWWNSHCLNTTYGEPKRNLHCSGSAPDSSITTVLKRFIGYLEEVERIGFYDQHQTPMTYLMASCSVIVSPRLFFYDMKDMFKVEEVLSNITGIQWSRTLQKSRAKPDKVGMPWTITWKELAVLRNTSNANYDPVVSGLATIAVNLVCKLYRPDIECLPYSIPECVY